MSRRKTKNYKRFELQLKENEKQLSELRDNRQYLDLNQTELDIDLKPNEKFKKVEGLNYVWVSQYGRVIQLKKSGKYYLSKLTDDTKKSGKTYQRIWIGELNESAYVHRLVAETWCKGYSEVCNEVHHIDGDGLNNHYKNLIWVCKPHHSLLDRGVQIYFMSNREKSDFSKVNSLEEVANRIGIDIRVLSLILNDKPDIIAGNYEIFQFDTGGNFPYVIALERKRKLNSKKSKEEFNDKI